MVMSELPVNASSEAITDHTLLSIHQSRGLEFLYRVNGDLGAILDGERTF